MTKNFDHDTLTLLATGDLHYNIARSRKPTEQLARQALDAGGDVLALLGDTAGTDLQHMREALRLFKDFPGQRLLVPGNHCLWAPHGQDSMQRYTTLLPALAGEEGFVLLDHAPQIVGPVGFVGSIGWYDYGFRDRELGIPIEFYREKVAPGAAAYYDDLYGQLVHRHKPELTERQLAITTRWMDGRHVNLGVSDEQFVTQLAEVMRRQIHEIAPRVDRIVVLMHHLPLAELLPTGLPDNRQFALAYMGSGTFGQVLRDEPKVAAVICGHSHWRARVTVDHIEAISVGSTYRSKELLRLEV